MNANVFGSSCEDAPKMVAPVRWCYRNWPVVSGCSSRAAPPAAGVWPIVPEASAQFTVCRSSGQGRRPGVVGW